MPSERTLIIRIKKEYKTISFEDSSIKSFLTQHHNITHRSFPILQYRISVRRFRAQLIVGYRRKDQ